MTLSRLGMHVLKLRLTLIRIGLSKIFAGTLCIVGLIAWVWAIPTLHNQHIAQQQSWINSQRDLHATGVNKDEDLHLTAEENFNHFTGVLGNPLDTEKQVRTLFELAKNTGLTLSKAEYKLAEEKNGRYRTYQILLPVKGSYNSIRRFCEKTLLAIPFASLDEMSFKRESIASGSLEARLRFTLYLSESDTESLKQGHSDLRSQKETP